MNKMELAIYAAGLFDGEGCISIGKARKIRPDMVSQQYQLAITINMTDCRGIERLYMEYGGSVNVRKKISGTNWKPVTSWRLNVLGARRFLLEIRPYAVVKSEQISIGLEFIELAIHSRKRILNGKHTPIPNDILEKRESLYLKMRSLNSRGVKEQ